MDPLQRRMAIAGVRALADDGFALAGGYALRAHGFGQRDSDDIDLFTDVLDPQRFAEAVDRLTGSPSWPRSDPAASGSDGPGPRERGPDRPVHDQEPGLHTRRKASSMDRGMFAEQFSAASGIPDARYAE
ncbi:hypothetical protein Kfla_5638 [Kribbella flavida DSM 17836]|uniref:Uncharacterized protein n=1 Tax=Kribbella flavida (strain DSM 17836 / JCM 10339 / NBRC 14399) TaxID=479435 RepID=D2PP48_KRIFD|nr:nucleotidyl transferase AbiEii/AbiGii toxin family protein [Kribbella flavida]ADB34644.1 hypothetical protein Kfla_5638 [Kribbella flavida DSM 17836]